MGTMQKTEITRTALSFSTLEKCRTSSGAVRARLTRSCVSLTVSWKRKGKLPCRVGSAASIWKKDAFTKQRRKHREFKRGTRMKKFKHVMRKLKNAFLLAATCIAAVTFAIGMLSIDGSESLQQPLILMAVSGAWLMLFFYANSEFFYR